MSNYQFKDLLDLGNGLAYYSDIVGSTKTEYYCIPRNPEMLITDRGWKIMRITSDISLDGDMTQGKAVCFAGGTPDFSFLATSLVYVAGLSYL